MSHIQPLGAALRPAYIEPYSLGFHNQRISSRIGLQHSGEVAPRTTLPASHPFGAACEASGVHQAGV